MLLLLSVGGHISGNWGHVIPVIEEVSVNKVVLGMEMESVEVIMVDGWLVVDG